MTNDERENTSHGSVSAGQSAPLAGSDARHCAAEPFSRNVRVTNESGLHARASTLIAKAARAFGGSRVELVKDRQRAEATDVLQILSLGAYPGVELVLEATGPDAERALEAVARLFLENFGE